MLKYLRSIIPDTHPFRLFYHKILAICAASIYRFPANKLTVIAITGTNGKTTTCNLLAHIFDVDHKKVGLSSSIFFQVGKKKWANITKQTTASPFMLQKLLRQMVKSGCQYAIIETTSHAMIQSRLFGINVDIAVLTNIMRDHLEYHGSFQNYIEAKGKLFSLLRSSDRKPGVSKVAIFNRDIPEFEYFDQFVADKKITYGLNKKASYYADNIELKAHESRFTLKIPNDTVDIIFKIPGKFNIYNALCASSIALACGVKLSLIKKALESAKGFPGRLEGIDMGQNFSIIVDYAHTTESLEAVLKVFKELTLGRLILVFGCTGGGRDKLKRPKMGAVAHKYADIIMVTDDDPYDEDEYEIIEQISKGIDRREGENFWKVIDRKEAIRLALHIAEKGDTVLITGKGCEQIIWLKEGKIPYDDRKVVRDVLEQEIL